MSVVGFQEFWTVGARFYFQRTAAGSPFFDLGVIQSVAPNFNVEKIELKDPDGGIRQLVDESVTDIEESYDLTISNFNMDNLSLLFLGSDPEEFTQSASEKTITHSFLAGRLVKIVDDDADSTFLYGLDAIIGIVKNAGGVTVAGQSLTDIVASTGVLTFAADVSGDISNGDRIAINRTGLADAGNAGTYEVLTVVTDTVTVTSSTRANLSSDETGVTVAVDVEDAAGDLFLEGVDYTVTNLKRGVVSALAAGTITAADHDVIFSLAALSGKRKFDPQAQGEIKGKAMLTLSRGDFAEETVREIESVSLAPTSADFSAENFSSFVLQAKVLKDLSTAMGAGRMLQYSGTLPAAS